MARSGFLFAAEKSLVKEITGIIHDLLKESNEETRLELIKRLKSFPAEEVGACWLAILNDTSRINMKVRIIDTMTEFNDKRFVLPLANYLVSPYFIIRKSAAKVLKKIGDDRLYPVILKMANSDNPVHKIYFVEAMNYLFDQRFYPALTNMLRDDNKSIRIYIVVCLKENKITESLGLLRSCALYDKNDEVRIAAIEAIGAFRDGNSMNVFQVALNDKNRDVRCESAKALNALGSLASVNALSTRLFTEDDNEIKDIMLDTLCTMKRIGDYRGLEKILLTDLNLSLRIKAAYLLGFSGNPGAFTALVQGLKDSDYRVKAEVCNSLGFYRNRQSLAVLFDVLEKNEPVYVKSAALYSIKRINDKISTATLFDLYTREKDPIFKELLRNAICEYIKKFI